MVVIVIFEIGWFNILYNTLGMMFSVETLVSDKSQFFLKNKLGKDRQEEGVSVNFEV